MIYFVEAVGVGNIKIGFTDSDDAAARVDCLQTGSPVPLRLLGTVPGSLADEKDLHRRFGAARVTGEWFRPVPDLVALIPDARRLVCGSAEVMTKSVQIRVLTVGRKQFTKGLLAQVQKFDPVDWPKIWATLARAAADKSATALADTVDLSQFVHGDVWGYVDDGIRTRAVPGTFHFVQRRKIVVWNRRGELRKFVYYSPVFSEDLPKREFASPVHESDFRAACHSVCRRVDCLPGWSDQLFIGV